MDDLQKRLEEVLNDPQQMQEIFTLAKSLGLELPETERQPEKAAEQPPQTDTAAAPPVQLPPGLGAAITPPVAGLLEQAGRLDKKQENLLNALKPFLKPARREKIDRAMQAARLSHLAGYALKSRGGQQKP